jgi:hypothetical protein
VGLPSTDSIGSPTSLRSNVAPTSQSAAPVFLSVLADDEAGFYRAVLRCMDAQKGLGLRMTPLCKARSIPYSLNTFHSTHRRSR